MQLPFSDIEPKPLSDSTPKARAAENTRAAALALPAGPACTPLEQAITWAGQAGELAFPLPVFDPHTPDDPTPANENQAEAWVNEMCKRPSVWLRRLAQLTRDFNPETLKEEFSMMYAENAEGSAANFLRRHFRRPDAPADAKPFPIRIEFFYLLLGALVVTIVLVMLVLFRKHNP